MENPIVQYRLTLLLSSCNFAHPPSAVIQRGGRVGLSSVLHGKLVAYKSYILLHYNSLPCGTEC